MLQSSLAKRGFKITLFVQYYLNLNAVKWEHQNLSKTQNYILKHVNPLISIYSVELKLCSNSIHTTYPGLQIKL